MTPLTARIMEGTSVHHKYPGFGTCYRCHRPWPICESHSTRFSEVEGCFPLCEDCWKELSKEERIPYYEILILNWIGQGMDKKEMEEKRILILKAVSEGK